MVSVAILRRKIELYEGNVRGERLPRRGGDGHAVGGNTSDNRIVINARQWDKRRRIRNGGIKDVIELTVTILIRPPAVNHDIGDQGGVK